MAYRAINPATEEPLESYEELDWGSVESECQKANVAWQKWKRKTLNKRSALFLKLAGILRSQSGDLAKLITTEMGKPIREAEAEIEKCAGACEHYAANSRKALRNEKIKTDAGKSYVRYEPLGVILAIMPWNFPFWQVIRCAVPALAAGNAVILKHAPSVPGCALALERIFEKAGFPKNIFKSLFLSNDAAARLIELPCVQGVTLTGSDRAGRAVAALAGKALKKTVLELGGSDPFIILSDADLDQAVPQAVQSRLLNSGQSCIAAKRFIVVEDIAVEFEKRLVAAIQNLKVGDPTDRQTDVGPLARRDLLDNLIMQVEESVARGAKLLIGGKKLEGKGFFFQPAILKDVSPGMPAFDEEIFGPVVSLFTVKNEEEAIQLANQTGYGLGASIWTGDLKRAEKLSSWIESGSVFINGIVHSDPRLPFGGIKNSGYGRELSSHGIREFVNAKTIWIA